MHSDFKKATDGVKIKNVYLTNHKNKLRAESQKQKMKKIARKNTQKAKIIWEKQL